MEEMVTFTLMITKKDHPEEFKALLKSRNGGRKQIVAIDPGIRNLMFASGEFNYKVEFDDFGTPIFKKITEQVPSFSLSSGKRQYECKTKIHNRKRNTLSTSGIKNWEDWFSQYCIVNDCSSTSLDFEKCKMYVMTKRMVYLNLFNSYANPTYRKLRWFGKIQKRRSIDNLVNEFKQKFGTPDQVIIIFGDWSRRKHFKGSPPTIGASLRKMFKKAGYCVMLLHEYRSSKQCFGCALKGERSDCTKFLKIKNPSKKSRETIKEILFHGLIRCETCSRIWNRDRNGSLNLQLIASLIAQDKPRPTCFQKLETPAVIASTGRNSIRDSEKRLRVNEAQAKT